MPGVISSPAVGDHWLLWSSAVRPPGRAGGWGCGEVERRWGRGLESRGGASLLVVLLRLHSALFWELVISRSPFSTALRRAFPTSIPRAGRWGNLSPPGHVSSLVRTEGPEECSQSGSAGVAYKMPSPAPTPFIWAPCVTAFVMWSWAKCADSSIWGPSREQRQHFF